MCHRWNTALNILHLLTLKQFYIGYLRKNYIKHSTEQWKKCFIHRGICIEVRLTCSHFFIHFSFECLCSSVLLLLSPTSASLTFPLQEMFCRHAQRTKPRDPRMQRTSKLWKKAKEAESKQCRRKRAVMNHLFNLHKFRFWTRY